MSRDPVAEALDLRGRGRLHTPERLAAGDLHEIEAPNEPAPGDEPVGAGAPWDSYQLPGHPDPDPLPTAALPGPLRRHVESVAANLQVPEDLPALLALGTISAAVAGKVEVAVRSGWREPVGIYAAPILPPASRKSPAFDLLTAPLREWEAERVADAAPRVLAAMDVVEVAEKRLERVKSTAAKGQASFDEVEAERLELERARAKVPPDGRILAGDVTPEAMVLRMVAQGGRLAVLEPEPGPLQLVAGRYSDTARLDELKKAWSSERIVVDRVGRPPVQVPRPALTLVLCLQPGVLEQLQNGPAFRVEGVLGRFLWCIPPHGLGTRLTGPDVPPLDEKARGAFVRIVRILCEMETLEPDTPQIIQLGPDALEILYLAEATVEAQLGDGQRLSSIRDWAGKSVGQMVRIACLLELAARAGDGRPLLGEPIGPWAMDSAVKIVTALSSHALVVLAGGGQGSRSQLLSYVLKRASELPPGSTLRDLYEATKGKSAITTVEDLRDLVEDLEDLGCLRVCEVERPGPGRPPSPLIEIHPDLQECARTIRTIGDHPSRHPTSANSANVGVAP